MQPTFAGSYAETSRSIHHNSLTTGGCVNILVGAHGSFGQVIIHACIRLRPALSNSGIVHVQFPDVAQMHMEDRARQ